MNSNKGIIISGGSIQAEVIAVGDGAQAVRTTVPHEASTSSKALSQPPKIEDERLAQATCGILRDGEICGTAWLASHSGHLITAGHLLGTENPLDEVEVKFSGEIRHKAYRIEWGYQEEMGLDFTILKLKDWHEREPLPISLTRSVSGSCTLFGYGQTLGGLSQGMGDFVGSYYPRNSTSNKLFRLRSSELSEEGYSGGAVFSHELQAVVAIQIETTRTRIGAGHDTVLAMPLYRIAHYWERLFKLEKKNKLR